MGARKVFGLKPANLGKLDVNDSLNILGYGWVGVDDSNVVGSTGNFTYYSQLNVTFNCIGNNKWISLLDLNSKKYITVR